MGTHVVAVLHVVTPVGRPREPYWPDRIRSAVDAPADVSNSRRTHEGVSHMYWPAVAETEYTIMIDESAGLCLAENGSGADG